MWGYWYCTKCKKETTHKDRQCVECKKKEK